MTDRTETKQPNMNMNMNMNSACQGFLLNRSPQSQIGYSSNPYAVDSLTLYDIRAPANQSMERPLREDPRTGVAGGATATAKASSVRPLLNAGSCGSCGSSCGCSGSGGSSPATSRSVWYMGIGLFVVVCFLMLRED